MMKKITFKSTPNNWRKEYVGLKRNTVREQDDKDDVRFEVLRDFIKGKLNMLKVEITNTDTGETFVQVVTDVTKYKKIFIISW